MLYLLPVVIACLINAFRFSYVGERDWGANWLGLAVLWLLAMLLFWPTRDGAQPHSLGDSPDPSTTSAKG
jgi:hypothetical protein